MRIACVIDSLGSGGAQRQLTAIAVALKRMGHEVCFLVYHRDDFFGPALKAGGVEVIRIGHTSKLRRILALRRQFRTQQPDVVLAFLQAPALYCELAGLPLRKWGLVVSERSHVGSRRGLPEWKQACHLLADYVTTNSHSNRLAIRNQLPALSGRVATIYNLLDLSVFRSTPAPVDDGVRPLRIVVAANHRELKNAQGLIQAVRVARQMQPGLRLVVEWYGRKPDTRDYARDTHYFDGACRLIRQYGLEDSVLFHEPVANIVPSYEAADAVALPSFVEGLPNTVCEGMACGRPILASRIADAEVLVEPGRNGFLFNPHDPEAMARMLVDFCGLSSDQRARMGRASRALAERLFEPTRVITAYLRLLEAAAGRVRVKVHHWPES